MSRLSAWRSALRLARRDAVRARGRSLLVLVMIALPVLAVTAADVVLTTQAVNGAVSLDRRLGTADALVTLTGDGHPVAQAFDPDRGSTSTDQTVAVPTEQQLSGLLGGARLLPVRTQQPLVATAHGQAPVSVLETDLRDPIASGLVRLTSGRLPSAPDEVVVNQALLDRGYAVGDRLDVVAQRATDPSIVGVAESLTTRTFPYAAGPIGAFGPTRGDWPAWLVAGGPVSWPTVQQLNAVGAVVLSRAVVSHPPPRSELAPEIGGWSDDPSSSTVAVAVLVVVMALLEVVLLAGPAFAVTARRQARSLALIAVAGGTPRQSRRVVLAGALVLGASASALGVVLGIGLAAAALPLLQRHSDSWFGPFDLTWWHLLAVAAFGLLSALGAAVVPGWVASRQDVVAVLAGRRADRAPSLRSPLLGLLLLGAGVAGSAYGATRVSNGEIAIAASAVVAVLGMILLVPVVVVAIARLTSRMPLTARYAARDAARHRTRTVPAVAAVAATVAGVVALGIGTSSDAAEREATYHQVLPMGAASITDYGRHPSWDDLVAALHRGAPDATVRPVRGVSENGAPVWTQLTATRDGRELTLGSYGGPLGASIFEDDGRGVASLPGIPRSQVDAASRVLAAGGAVVFADQGGGEATTHLGIERQRGEHAVRRTEADLPTLALRPGGLDTMRAVLSPEAVRALGLRTQVVSLLVGGPTITQAQQRDVEEALTEVSQNVSLYVERGYQADSETVVVQLVLAALGAVLMLGGTLTATFLALSDARPDLATLGAVGASPRRRRGVAAAYALVIGFVGAVLGAAVGFVPGIAVTYPLTVTRGDSCVVNGSGSCTPSGIASGPYVDVPWLLVLGLVVALPLVTAAIVGLTARSRLPGVARIA